jgi:hypothetical protein
MGKLAEPKGLPQLAQPFMIWGLRPYSRSI